MQTAGSFGDFKSRKFEIHEKTRGAERPPKSTHPLPIKNKYKINIIFRDMSCSLTS